MINGYIKIFQPIISIFRFISQGLMFMAKIIFILLCFYYIVNWSLFTLSFNVPKVLRAFMIIDIPLKMLEFIGLSFCVIPMSIVIVSFFHSNTGLRIISNFFAVSGNIFSSYHLMSKGLLDQYFRTPLFTIYNIPSLDTKKALFSEYFNTRINLYLDKIEDPMGYKHFIEKNLELSWGQHLQTLKTMPQDGIIKYSSDIADKAYKSYIDFITTPIMEQTIQKTSFMPSWGTVVGGVILVASLGYALYIIRGYLLNLTEEVMDLNTKQHGIIQRNKDTDDDIVNNSKGIGTLSDSVHVINDKVNFVQQDLGNFKTIVTQNATQLKQGLTVTQDLYNQLREQIFHGKANLENFVTAPLSQTTIDLAIITDKIKLLTNTNLITNDTVVTLSKGFDNIQTEITSVKARLAKAEYDTQNIMVDYNPILDAARQRQVDQALEKIRDFDIATVTSNLRSDLRTYVNHTIDCILLEKLTPFQEQQSLLTKTNQDFQTSISADITNHKNTMQERISILQDNLDLKAKNETLMGEKLRQTSEELRMLNGQVFQQDTAINNLSYHVQDRAFQDNVLSIQVSRDTKLDDMEKRLNNYHEDPSLLKAISDVMRRVNAANKDISITGDYTRNPIGASPWPWGRNKWKPDTPNNSE